jgi:hypothetical protein
LLIPPAAGLLNLICGFETTSRQKSEKLSEEAAMSFTVFKKSSKLGALFLVLSAVAPAFAGLPGELSGGASAKPQAPVQVAFGDPAGALFAPIEIRASIPPEDAGIINFARVPDETGFAVLICAAYGLDVHSPDAIRFIIDDGIHLPYRRDPGCDTVRVVKLAEAPDERATLLWAVYDRILEPFMPTGYPPDRVVHIEVEIKDAHNNVFRPEPFEFKIESAAEKAASRKNLPQTDEFYTADQFSENGYEAGIAVTGGRLYGARVLYNSREPLTPEFGSPNAIEEISLEGMRAAGVPVNLSPHTVFDNPVTLFLPVSEDADLRSVGLAYFDGTQWMPAADADGNVLPGAEGWMVPGSRVNHAQSSPPLVEVQVHHFSGAQAVVIVPPDGTQDQTQNKDHTGGANVVVFANCFINSATSDVGFDFWPLSLFAGMVILLGTGIRHKASGVRLQANKKAKERILGLMPCA